jgi:hypothetical protein
MVELFAKERLDFVNKESFKNNLKCDHKYLDGRWAESAEAGICAICGCGMGYQHYLKTH